MYCFTVENSKPRFLTAKNVAEISNGHLAILYFKCTILLNSKVNNNNDVYIQIIPLVIATSSSLSEDP